MDILKYFPYKDIRPEQESVLAEIFNNWNNKKYFILQCDVGTGKSGIAKTVANFSENSFIITETKQLQQQYIDDFKHENNMISIKGKANYQCNRNQRLNCETGPCTIKSNKGYLNCMNSCKYYSTRKKAIESKIVLTSYAYIFRAFDCSNLWKPRELLVFDECHLLENQLINFASFELDVEYLNKQFGLFEMEEEYSTLYKEKFTSNEWNEDNKNKFEKILNLISIKKCELFEMMKEEIGDDVSLLDDEDSELLSTTHKLYYEIDKLYKKMILFKSVKKDDWVIGLSTYGSLVFTPLNVNYLFKMFCDNWAKKFIFMSATILDIEGFINDLGIDKDDCLVVNVPSSFSPDKSPIYYMPCGSMNYNNIDETLPKACETIDKILSHKKDDKGIIHTGNYKVATKIYKDYKNISKVNRDRFLIKFTDEVTNQNLINLHTRSKNTVLLSPSMTTGVDLKDDLSRFQIIVKMPFMSLADPRTKKKSELNNDWYVCQMLKTLIQACGRSTRSSDDYSATYVLDSSFKYYVTRYKKWLPEYFLNRIKGI